MIDKNDLFDFPEYAHEAEAGNKYDDLAEYADGSSTSQENYRRGFEPLETFPSCWYNTMMGFLSKHAQLTTDIVTSIYDEIQTILADANITPTTLAHDQLERAILKLTELKIATTSQLGGLKASSQWFGVGIDSSTGEATLNKTNSADLWDVSWDTNTGKLHLNKQLVTASSDGLMSATDKAKLEGIQAGAQVNPTITTSTPTLQWGQTSTVVTVDGQQAQVTMPANPVPGIATTQQTGLVKSSATGTVQGKDYNVEVNSDGTMKVNVPWTDTIYTLPTASSDALGGIKTGYTENGKNYAVKVQDDRAYVTVPWTDTIYTLPTASSDALGGIKTGYTENGKNYAVKVQDDRAYVTVPWTDTTYDLEDYAMKSWVNSQGFLTSHQSLAGYATESWVNSQGFLTSHQSLAGYATESWVNSQEHLKCGLLEGVQNPTNLPSTTKLWIAVVFIKGPGYIVTLGRNSTVTGMAYFGVVAYWYT